MVTQQGLHETKHAGHSSGQSFDTETVAGGMWVQRWNQGEGNWHAHVVGVPLCIHTTTTTWHISTSL